MTMSDDEYTETDRKTEYSLKLAQAVLNEIGRFHSPENRLEVTPMLDALGIAIAKLLKKFDVPDAEMVKLIREFATYTINLVLAFRGGSEIEMLLNADDETEEYR
jgi:hypothetical protein